MLRFLVWDSYRDSVSVQPWHIDLMRRFTDHCGSMVNLITVMFGAVPGQLVRWGGAIVAVATIVARSMGSMIKRVDLGLVLSQRAAKDAAATPRFDCLIASAVG